MICAGFIAPQLKSLNIKKDSTLALMEEAQARKWQISHIIPTDIYAKNGLAYTRKVEKICFSSNFDHKTSTKESTWYSVLEENKDIALEDFDVLFIREDPPTNLIYIHLTHLLSYVSPQKTLIVNPPQALREYNEKLFATVFHQHVPQYVIASNRDTLLSFINDQESTILKPLDNMGGELIFHISSNDPNKYVALETITQNFTQPIIAQTYIPEIKAGDKRIIIINGEPIPFSLTRIPKEDETRANLAKGGTAICKPLTKSDLAICKTISNELIDLQLLFVGIDVIGDKLTEINITSPTGIRELDEQCNLNISKQLLKVVEEKLKL